MSKELERKKQQCQELLVNIRRAGSYESVGLTEQLERLVAEIQQQERQELEAQLHGVPVPVPQPG